ncbi:5118_t:CDS:2, partial [Ambispora gerdemannii]
MKTWITVDTKVNDQSKLPASDYRIRRTSTPPLHSSNALVMLEINSGNYKWQIPKVTPNMQPIPYYHNATIIDDIYMIVAFGKEDGMLIGDATSNINKRRMNRDATSNAKHRQKKLESDNEVIQPTSEPITNDTNNQ